MHFEQSRSLFAGMSQPALQAALTNAQNALISLQTGQQAVVVTYSQGEGNRSVTYQRTNMGALVALIGELKACLGLASQARRGLRMSF